MPTFSGVGDALIRRITIIPFYHRIPEDLRNPHLASQLSSKMGVVVAWALEGARRLVANKLRFSQSDLIDEKIREFKETLSASILFTNEIMKKDENNFVEDDELYDSYKNWCIKRGKKVQNYYTFFKDIEDNLGIEKIVDFSTKKKGRMLSYKETESPISPDQITF